MQLHAHPLTRSKRPIVRAQHLLPRKIETYDISNLSGTNMVAGMCVMQDGIIKKNLSRRFKIKTVYGQDDPACMKEVLSIGCMTQ